MQKLVDFLLFILGVSLWIPGIAIAIIGSFWGLQFTSLFSLILLALVPLGFFAVRSSGLFFRMRIFRQIPSNIYFIYLVFVLASLASALTSVDPSRSTQSFAAEMIGLVFSFSLSIWFCQNPNNTSRFISGFRAGGLISAVYSLYQVVGLRNNLPLAYPPINNTSFTLITEGAAIGWGRSFGITPEPSIFASLLLPLLGILTIDLLMHKGIRYYVPLLIAIAAYALTGSQSLVLVPIYLTLVIGLTSKIAPTVRKLRIYDIAGIILLVAAAIAVISTNPTVAIFISRIFDPATNESAAERGNDIQAAFKIFAAYPITGSGLGSLFSIAQDFGAISQGSTSGFFRMLAEQGLVGLVGSLVIAVCLIPNRLRRLPTVEQATLVCYSVSLITAVFISHMLFVGYRAIYHLWLLIPLAISLKTQFEGQKVNAPTNAPALSNSTASDPEIIFAKATH